MAQNAALAADGQYRVWVQVTFNPAAEQLAEHLWDGLTSYERTVEWHPEYKISMERVRKAVETSIFLRGSQWFVEDDDQYDEEGGREWALVQVKRTYKFPQN